MAGRKNTATLELIIGVTIIAGIIVLIAMIMAWGSSSSLFAKHYKVVVIMNNIGALRSGAPVKLGGFQIGKVSNIQPRPGSIDLEVILDIDESRLLPKGSTARISTSGLVGDDFVEIIPSKSTETIRRSSTVAEAERINSQPPPDFTKLLSQATKIGDQLSELTSYINDILGDDQFRKHIKSMVANLDYGSYEASTLIQKSNRIADNIESSSQNITELTKTLKTSVDKATNDVLAFTTSARKVADKAQETLDNINQSVIITKGAINKTLGDEKFINDLKKSVDNITALSDSLSAKRKDLEATLVNAKDISKNIKDISVKFKDISTNLDANKISEAFNNLSTGIKTATELIEKIKEDPVLLLSINKAADRIIKMKFEELAKQHKIKSANEALEEISSWANEALNRGYFKDPKYNYNSRPYVIVEEDIK